MPKLYIGDSNNTPQRIKKIWIGNTNNTPIKIKKMWIGDANNQPKLIYSAGLPEGYLFNFDASSGQYLNGRIDYLINTVNGVYYKLQPWHLINDPTSYWNVSSWNGRPISFNNQTGRIGRGGTFRFPTPSMNATLVCVQRLDSSLITTNDLFTNSCYFNTAGEYQYFPDYFTYSGTLISDFSFRKLNYNQFFFNDRDLFSLVNQKLCCVWMVANSSGIFYRIKNLTTYNEYSTARKSNLPIQDVRVCDWSGGGVEPLTGDLYEFAIWNRALSTQEMIEAEEFLLEKWK